MGINYFTYAGKMSTDFGVWISGESTYQSPEKDIESVVVPGRNGALTIDNNRFQNINIPYNAYIIEDFSRNFDALKAFLISVKGYEKLIDTYHPEYYRLARFHSAIEPEMTQLNRHGQFAINFDCDPRRFLKEGIEARELQNGDILFNPTQFDARPLIRAYGTGTLGVGEDTITITQANEYTDIDCDLMDAYKGQINCNSNIILNSGKFPTLPSGESGISLNGITRVVVYPRWFTL